jgi:hypothetical protein
MCSRSPEFNNGRRCIVMTYLILVLAVAAVAYMFLRSK